MKNSFVLLLPFLFCLISNIVCTPACRPNTILADKYELKKIIKIEPTSDGVQIMIDANYNEDSSTKLGVAVRVVEKDDDKDEEFQFVNLQNREIYTMNIKLASGTQFIVESYLVTPLGPIGKIVTQKFSTLPEKIDCALKVTSVIAYPNMVKVGLDNTLCPNLTQDFMTRDLASLVLNFTSTNSNEKSEPILVTNLVDLKATKNQFDAVFSLETIDSKLSVCERYNMTIFLSINGVTSHVTIKSDVQPKLDVIKFKMMSPIIINDPTPNVPDNVEGDYTSETPSAILKFMLNEPLNCLIHGLEVSVNKFTETAYMTSGQNGIIVLSQQSLKVLRRAMKSPNQTAKILICLTQPQEVQSDSDEGNIANNKNCQILHPQILAKEFNIRSHDELQTVKEVHEVYIMSKQNEIYFHHCHDPSVFLASFEFLGSTMKRETQQESHGCPQGQQETIMSAVLPEGTTNVHDRTISFDRAYYGNFLI